MRFLTVELHFVEGWSLNRAITFGGLENHLIERLMLSLIHCEIILLLLLFDNTFGRFSLLLRLCCVDLMTVADTSTIILGVFRWVLWIWWRLVLNLFQTLECFYFLFFLLLCLHNGRHHNILVTDIEHVTVLDTCLDE